MTHDFHPPQGLKLSERDAGLRAWLIQSLAEDPAILPGGEPVHTRLELQPLSGDAGFRRYFRLFAAGRATGLLVVDAPPASENTRVFAGLARFLAARGVRTPRLLAVDEVRGFLIVEDLGDGLLQSALTLDSAPMLYGQALMTLLRLQQLTPPDDLVEAYDQPMLRRELQLFIDWFVTALLGYSLSGDEKAHLEQQFSLIEQSALEQPQVLVHRDYHSRNLLLCADGDLGVIDFQGAVVGPCTYDLVSLLRDCYLRWPQEQVKRWSQGYANLAFDAGLIPPVTSEVLQRWFDWMGLQRHLKVLGIFARLWLRDQRPQYLGDLTRVLAYVLEVTAQYEELRWLDGWLAERLLPLVRAQDWFRPADLAEID